jgi:hypothetical protein
VARRVLIRRVENGRVKEGVFQMRFNRPNRM